MHPFCKKCIATLVIEIFEPRRDAKQMKFD